MRARLAALPGRRCHFQGSCAYLPVGWSAVVAEEGGPLLHNDGWRGAGIGEDPPCPHPQLHLLESLISYEPQLKLSFPGTSSSSVLPCNSCFLFLLSFLCVLIYLHVVSPIESELLEDWSCRPSWHLAESLTHSKHFRNACRLLN